MKSNCAKLALSDCFSLYLFYMFLFSPSLCPFSLFLFSMFLLFLSQFLCSVSPLLSFSLFSLSSLSPISFFRFHYVNLKRSGKHPLRNHYLFLIAPEHDFLQILKHFPKKVFFFLLFSQIKNTFIKLSTKSGMMPLLKQ